MAMHPGALSKNTAALQAARTRATPGQSLSSPLCTKLQQRKRYVQQAYASYGDGDATVRRCATLARRSTATLHRPERVSPGNSMSPVQDWRVDNIFGCPARNRTM